MDDATASTSSRSHASLGLTHLALAAAVAALGAVGWAGWSVIQQSREAAARSRCNLGQIRLAMENYQVDHGVLPPACLVGPKGEPLLSWRVLLLPYMDDEQKDLYSRFCLNEPWDSEHNIALLAEMPKSYAVEYERVRKLPPHHTVYRVFTGPGALFEGGVNSRQDCPDGKDSTLLFVEAGEPVPWSRPDDFHFLSHDSVVLRGMFPGYCRAMAVEGSYRYLREELPQSTLRALLTRDGGESLPENWSSYRPPRPSQQ